MEVFFKVVPREKKNYGQYKTKFFSFWGKGCPFINVKQRIPVMLWSVSDPMSHAEVLLFSPSICPQKGYVVMSLSLSSCSVGQQTSINSDITPVSLPFLHPSIWQHGGASHSFCSRIDVCLCWSFCSLSLKSTE